MKFELKQNYQLAIEAKGNTNAASRTANGDGGREYTVTYKDVDGKLAPAGSVVRVFFAEGTTSRTGTKVHVDDTLNGEAVYDINATSKDTFVTGGNYVDLKVDSKGQVTFTVTGLKDSYATPIAIINNGTKPNEVDSADLVQNGGITYFVNAEIKDAKLSITSAKTNKSVTSVTVDEDAWFTYSSVDQNGFTYYSDSTKSFVTTFQVDTRFADVDVYDQSGAKLNPVSSVNGRSTFYVTAVNGVAKLKLMVNQLVK